MTFEQRERLEQEETRIVAEAQAALQNVVWAYTKSIEQPEKSNELICKAAIGLIKLGLGLE